jgi:hypothetical protein
MTFLIRRMTAAQTALLHNICKSHVYRCRHKVLFVDDSEQAQTIRKLIGWPIKAEAAKAQHFRPANKINH